MESIVNQPGPGPADLTAKPCAEAGDHRAGLFHHYLHQGDMLADDVVGAFAGLPDGQGRRMLATALAQGIEAVPDAPQALKALFAQLDHVPFWVDWETLDRGGMPFRRTGRFGAMIMGCYALPLAYSSGAGVKPLIVSGRLVHRASRRLAETALFNADVSAVGGLRRFADGFATVVRVRLIHAQVRYLLRRSGQWDAQSWGAPINQVDMAGANLFFAGLSIDGLRRLGFRFSRRERADAMQLWRYCGYLSGIHPDLLCATEEEGRRLGAMVMETRLVPDDDSRTLVSALMERAMPELMLRKTSDPDGPAARRVARFCYGLSASFLGKRRSRELGYPDTWWRIGAPLLLRLGVWPAELLRRTIPGGTAYVVRLATGLLRRTTERALAGAPATYDLPDALGDRNATSPPPKALAR